MVADIENSPLRPTHPHNFPSNGNIQYPALSFDQREPIAGAGYAGVYQLAGKDGVGRLR